VNYNPQNASIYYYLSRRDLRDHSNAAGGGGIFDLVPETDQEQGLDQLGTANHRLFL